MAAISILEIKKRELDKAHDNMLKKAQALGFMDGDGNLSQLVLDIMCDPSTEISKYKLDNKFPPINEQFYEFGDAIRDFNRLSAEYEALKKSEK